MSGFKLQMALLVWSFAWGVPHLGAQPAKVWYPSNAEQKSQFDSAFSTIQAIDFVVYYQNRNSCNACTLFNKYLPQSLRQSLLLYDPVSHQIRSIQDSLIASNKFLNSTIKNITRNQSEDFLIKINKELRIATVTPFTINRNYQTIENLLKNPVIISNSINKIQNHLSFLSTTNIDNTLFALSTGNEIMSHSQDGITMQAFPYPLPSYLDFIQKLPIEISKDLIKDLNDKEIKEYIETPIQIVQLFGRDSLSGVIYQINCLKKHNDTSVLLGYYFVQYEDKLIYIPDIHLKSYLNLAPMLYSNRTINGDKLTIGNYINTEIPAKNVPLFTEIEFSKNNRMEFEYTMYIPKLLYNQIFESTKGFMHIHQNIENTIFFEYGGVILTAKNKLIVPQILTACLQNSNYQYCKLIYVNQHQSKSYRAIYSLGYSLVDIVFDNTFEIAQLQFYSIKPYWNPSHINNGLFFMGNHSELRLGRFKFD